MTAKELTDQKAPGRGPTYQVGASDKALYDMTVYYLHTCFGDCIIIEFDISIRCRRDIFF